MDKIPFSKLQFEDVIRAGDEPVIVTYHQRPIAILFSTGVKDIKMIKEGRRPVILWPERDADAIVWVSKDTTQEQEDDSQ